MEDTPPWVEIEKIKVISGQSITISGNTALLEGSCLMTQLFEGNSPVDWWTDIATQVEDGSWAVSCQSEAVGASVELKTDTTYVLSVRECDELNAAPVLLSFTWDG